MGVAAVCWAIWRCRNNIIFNKIKVNSVLQVIFRGHILVSFLGAVAVRGARQKCFLQLEQTN